MKTTNRFFALTIFILAITSFAFGQDTTLTVTSDGKVGIGTTNPQAQLHVKGWFNLEGSDFWMAESARGDGGRALVHLGNGTGLDDQLVLNFAGDFEEGVQIQGAKLAVVGNVGIGTATPASKLEVAGIIHSTSGGVKFPDGSVQSSAASSGLWGSSGNNIYYNAGNVGIGWTTPDYPLHIYSTGQVGQFVDQYSSSTSSNTYGILVSSENIAAGSSTTYGVNASGTAASALNGDRVYGVRGFAGGISPGTKIGVYGFANGNGTKMGVLGSNIDGFQGYLGGDGYGVWGYRDSNHWGYLGADGTGGGIKGNFHVNGVLTAAVKLFKIDHPLDPGNKYLYHSCIESDEQANVYSGNVTLNSNGEATVQLSDWFQSLNMDFRYQLTCIGGFAQVYIAEEIANNRFKIAGGKAGMKVSWQVTGVRHDAYVKANKMIVEVEKVGEERGKYLTPKEHGMPESMGIEYEKIQKMEANIKKMEAEESGSSKKQSK